MPEIGQTILHYRITEKLGQGGMGEVFMAHDTSLDRKVALKFLPDIFSGDPERLARFEREAKLLASLNHPNIATIYGLEQADGKRFLAMELVEGETLAQQIERGPLSVDEALEVCRQIAEGLEAAHEKGVIHRDLKPANVKITPEGKVKILDFGLAKALQGEPLATDASQSPTLTNQMTQAGVILGTAAYMAPEQAKGRSVDRRADIWAFGCILYECVTAKAVFQGETITETLASVLKNEPDWNSVPKTINRRIKALMQRCLEKDPRQRLHDIADGRIEIDDAIASPSEAEDSSHGARRCRPLALALTLSAAILGGIFIGALLWNNLQGNRAVPKEPMRFVMPLPRASDAFPAFWVHNVLAISPDGSHLACVAAQNGTTRLFLQRIGQLDVTPITGTEGAMGPFFSSDGAWLGFFAPGGLKKVSIADASVSTIYESAARGLGGAYWGAGGAIFFSPISNSGISQIPATGGVLQSVTTLDRTLREASHRFPQLLPGGEKILYTVRPDNIASYDDAQIWAQQIGTQKRQLLIQGAAYARYVPTGHIVYARGGELFAIPFDLTSLKQTGKAVSVLKGIKMQIASRPQFAFSDTGVLVYVSGTRMGNERSLVWVDRQGNSTASMKNLNNFGELAISPDGKRLVVRIGAPNDDLWLGEPARGEMLTRFTDEDSDQLCPVWTPTGDRVAYSSEAGGSANLCWRAADGSGKPEQLLTTDKPQYPGSFSPNGEWLAYHEIDPKTRADIWLLPIRGERKPQLFARTDFDEREPNFSRDGSWLAYVSNRSGGRNEIYIQPFPGPGGAQQISADGGDHPVWARTGQELFYRNGNRMMGVFIDKQGMKPGSSHMLFEGNYLQGTTFSWYDVAADGRFLMVSEQEPEVLTQIHIILNWFEELKRLCPIK